MLKKLLMMLAIVAAFGLVISVPSASDAKPANKSYTKKSYVKKSYGNKNYVKKSYVHKNFKGSKSKYVFGHSYGGHVYYGHHRHRWHGRWYDYGVGPCWINVDGIWFWNIVACP